MIQNNHHLKIEMDISVPEIRNPKQKNQSSLQLSKWQEMVKGIVRPPRSKYKDSSLGAKQFSINSNKYSRQDKDVMHQEKKIILTIYEPQVKSEWIILYLHGNSSSRVQCTGLLRYLPVNFSLASFDFIGCGLNLEEDFISLGFRESEQVQTVVKYLELLQFKVILWGRSMGAATALKYGRASVIVADSSFQSFKSLCKSVSKQNAPQYLPNCFINCIFPCVFQKLRSDVKDQAKYDVQELNISKDVARINKNTLLIFMSGDEDKLISKEHSERLYKQFQGLKKHLIIFQGTHNSKRPQDAMKRIMSYIEDHIKKISLEKTQSPSKGIINFDLA